MEKLPQAGIGRGLESELWRSEYVNQKYLQVDWEVQVRPKPKSRLRVEMDQLWSLVDNKGNQHSVWLAMDVATREIVGCYIGDPSWQIGWGTLGLLSCVYRPSRHQSAIFGCLIP